MKKPIILLFLIINISTFSQISEGGLPFALKYRNTLKGYISPPIFQLKQINNEALLKEDAKFPTPYRYAIIEPTNINIKEGLKTSIPDSIGEMWQYKIQCNNAYSIQLIFKKFIIPEGAKLFLYNEQFTKIIGAFNSTNTFTDSTLTIADFEGNIVIAEYFEPTNKKFSGEVIIGSIGKAYKNIFSSSIDEKGYIGINCPEGNNWQINKHAVCKISFNIGFNSYLCSGSFINNVNNNGKPYFLTANHCISDSSTKGIIAYFNYEQNGCNGNVSNTNTLSGAKLISTGKDSDYSLLEFNNTPPSSYQPYYAGWDLSSTPAKSGTGIHHPEGFTKKISIANNNAKNVSSTITWDNQSISPVNTHWEIKFDLGKTNTGSSGSPLFNEKKLIVGQLHGGDNNTSLYGKLYYSWTNSLLGYKTLQYYLDPNSTNKTFTDGYAPSTNFPDAHFIPELQQVCISAPIKFTDNSPFSPTKWQWTFTPNTVTFLDSSNSSSQNPTVSFNNKGDYDVKMIATNANGSDSILLNNYIQAGNTLNINILASNFNESCYDKIDTLEYLANGASSFEWSLTSGSENYFRIININSNPLKIVKNTNITADYINQINIQVNGISGNCYDTKSEIFSINRQINDNINTAIALQPGTNGPYTNLCATIQTGEPIPPATSFASLLSQLKENINKLNIIENTIWFTFSPLKTQTYTYTISATDFDCKIAIYSANSTADLLSGKYTFLSTNDYETNTNSILKIKNIKLEAGKTYYIQVDGNGEGNVGTFYLTITANNITKIENTSKIENINIFPQPANSIIYFNGELINDNNIYISIHNIAGIKVFAKKFTNIKNSTLNIDVSSWGKGIYIAKIVNNRNTGVVRFLVE